MFGQSGCCKPDDQIHCQSPTTQQRWSPGFLWVMQNPQYIAARSVLLVALPTALTKGINSDGLRSRVHALLPSPVLSWPDFGKPGQRHGRPVSQHRPHSGDSGTMPPLRPDRPHLRHLQDRHDPVPFPTTVGRCCTDPRLWGSSIGNGLRRAQLVAAPYSLYSKSSGFCASSSSQPSATRSRASCGVA